MKRCLVTGAAGFIGSHLVKHMLQRGWQVVGLDRLDSAASLRRLNDVNGHRCFQFVWHDLRSPNMNNASVLRQPFDYVAHLAASSHVTRSVQAPLEFIDDNVIGTAHLLEWTRRNAVKKFLYFSTDEVFGPAPEGVTYDEYSQHTPNNPYAASKAAAEALIPAWANTYGMPLVVTHCTNVYGPDQHEEKFVPLVIEKVRNGEIVQIHSRNGEPSSRYYVHVRDVCRAVVTVLEKGGVWCGPVSGKYNISGDQEHSNLFVAEAIANLMGLPLKYELVEFVPDRPRHDQRYAIRSTRLEALGWRPEVPLMKGLAEVVGEHAGTEAA